MTTTTTTTSTTTASTTPPPPSPVGHEWETAGSARGRRAADWACLFEHYASDVIQAIFPRIGIESGSSVLDIACGSGLAIRLADGIGATTAGIDAAADLIEIARDRAPEADLVVGTMFDLPWDDDSFDAVMSINGVWGGCEGALTEAWRVLRPGGRIGISFWGHGHLDLYPCFTAFALNAPESHLDGMRRTNNIARPGVAEQMLEAADGPPHSAHGGVAAGQMAALNPRPHSPISRPPSAPLQASRVRLLHSQTYQLDTKETDMNTSNPGLNEDRSPLLTAPDGCTTFWASSIPTACQIADWCHPRANPDRRLDESIAALAEPLATPGRLLGIWAHPDDEAYLSAGMMARVIDDGGHVTVVAITDGEAGFPDDDPRSSEERSALRRRELRAAMGRIGVSDVRFLGVADGKVAQAPSDALAAEIGSIIRDVEPDVIVTFGPDGITGHSDHIANSDLVTRAWTDNRIGELWYAAKTDEWLAAWRDLHDDFGVWMTQEPTGVRPQDAELVVDLDDADLVTKRAVLAEHHSQTDALATAFGEDRYRRWICQEVFRRPSAAELSGRRVLTGSVAS